MTKNDIKFMILVALVVIISALTLSSCNGLGYDSPYDDPPQEEPTDTSDWHDDYPNIGVLTTDITPATNPLVNTKWVLTEFRIGYGPIQHPNDTITFLSSGTYNINSGGAHHYTLSSIPSSTNKSLTFEYFWPFGGSHYSGNVGGTFVEDGQIISNFTDLDNSTIEIQAYFTRIE